MAERSRERTVDTDKCLTAMKEDLAAWMSRILNLMVMAETLLEDLETGVVLCRLANTIQSTGEEILQHNLSIRRDTFPPCGVTYKERTGFRGSFLARDNVANFIRWCRQLGVSDIIMFETEDLVLHKNEKSVILTLMDVARLSVKFGLEPPDLVRLENEIDQEIEEQPDEIMEEPMVRLKKKHKSHSLDDLVYQVLEQCTCPVRFPVLRVAEGKYRMGESKSLIFVRVMRKHVMVRVGGGWDTLERYFDKHDPCKMSAERQRRNSVRSPRSRSGSDVIGRSPSSMSISSTDGHDSCGIPVAHGRTASWSSPQTSQPKSPRDPAMRRMTSVSPLRSSSPSSPRLQHRQRRGTLTRDTPPRTIDTQARGRLSRKSKSMQELSSVVVDGCRPSYSNPTTSSIRKQSVTGESSHREGTSTSNGNPGQARRKSSVSNPRKLSGNLGLQGDSPAGRSRLSSGGPVGSPRSGPVQVTRSASFGARPRPVTPVMEPRAKSTVTSRPTRDMQRRASTATAGRIDSSEEARRRELITKRRSSSATPDGKTRLSDSTKPAQNSAEDKQERSRKPSVSKIPSPQPKTTQSVANRKILTDSTEHARGRRSLPSTPRERKSSTSQQNGLVKTSAKAIAVERKTRGSTTPPFSRRENKLVNQKKELESKTVNEKKTTTENRTKKGSQTNYGDESMTDSVKGTNGMESLPIELENNPDRQSSDQSIDSSDQLDEVDDNYNEEVFSLDETYSPKLALNGGGRTSECSFETDSDFTSDRLSDLTDTDYDFRSQRYSGLSETSSDFSFGTSPALKLFHSVENDRNNPLESSGKPNVLEIETSPTLKDCLMNLNLQGSVTPTMKRRIFEAAPQTEPKEESLNSTQETVSDPANKAVFFDVERYNDRSPDEEEVITGSPLKLSLVQSLINSIERRSGSSSDIHKAHKNAAVVTRPAPGTTSKHNTDESAVTARTSGNHETSCVSLPPSRVLKEGSTTEIVENRIEQRLCTSEEVTVPRDHRIGYDVNRNLTNSVPSLLESNKPQQIPGEKPFEGSENKTRKMSREKTRRKEKEMDIFPRPQRQFTLEEMIQDMMPANGESKETGVQRTLSPESRFQAWL